MTTKEKAHTLCTLQTLLNNAYCETDENAILRVMALVANYNPEKSDPSDMTHFLNENNTKLNT